MVCGGFACSRNALCALNVVYVLVGVLLVGVAGWARGLGMGSSPPLLGGAFAVGVFLLLIAGLGLLGPHQAGHSDQALKILGGVGLFFSFTEVLGVWLALRFRNQRDPRANPRAFL
uniref:Tetraspanin 31 n=1 Tax=Corvus moneduloides TaxID=1196302 RepID=A0A8U7NVS8_CORMO